MGQNKTETVTVFPSKTVASVLLLTRTTNNLWFTGHCFSMGFCRCRVYNLATSSSFKRTNNHSSKAKERTAESFQYLAIKFGRYRSSSRKFVCTVICCGWTVSFLSNTDRPLHLLAGLCCDIFHGHSHDLLDFPSDNDGTEKVRGHSKMDWLQSDGDSKPYEKAGDNSLGISNSNCISTTLHYGIRRND